MQIIEQMIIHRNAGVRKHARDFGGKASQNIFFVFHNILFHLWVNMLSSEEKRVIGGYSARWIIIQRSGEH